MSATIDPIARRYIRSLLWSLLGTVVSACLLATTLPKLDLPWLALPATACLFWSWERRRWREAVGLGFLCGTLYFCWAFRWFGETAGTVVGWFAPFIILIPALAAALSFAFAAFGFWVARRYAKPEFVPLAAALAFSIAENLRNYTILANPFGEISFPQVSTVFGTLAAYLGAAGVTLGVTFVGATLAQLIAKPQKSRMRLLSLAIFLSILILANYFAPANHYAAPQTPVAIVQGNIRQSLKWSPEALPLATTRYVGLSQSIGNDAPGDIAHPRLVLWPETVIPTYLDADPALQQRFHELARSLGTTLILGSLERRDRVPYNTLWFIDHSGVTRIYRKRKLVPFAEMLPAANLLERIPLTNVVSRFGAGIEATVVPVGELHVAPLICWESEFPDLLNAQIQKGADVFVLSTDDAWFGESDGPYQHAQIAQMRAIESGRWFVRSAATGISGIIAPDGRFTERSMINSIAVIRGHVGKAVDTPFNHLGEQAVLIGMIVLYGLLVGPGLFHAKNSRRI